MAVLKAKYGAKTAITITLDSLANAAVAVSSAIDNSTNLFQKEITAYYRWATAQDKKYPVYFFAPITAPPPVTFNGLLLAGD